MEILLRLILEDRPGALAHATSAIADVGGNILAMDVVDGDGKTVVDDFVVDLDGTTPQSLAELLASLPSTHVECVRVSPQTELHKELELISTLAADPTSLDLLARLVPAIMRCDWAVVISSEGSAVAVTHASLKGPRIRWTNVPWLPLETATLLDVDEDWVPASHHSVNMSLAVAPVNEATSVLACREAGPAFRPREIDRLAQLGQLVGHLLHTGSPAATMQMVATRFASTTTIEEGRSSSRSHARAIRH